MPNNRSRDGTVYIVSGNPDTSIENWTLNLQNIGYAPGELGTDYSWTNKRYQIVHMDPASTSPSAPNALAFWVDKAKYIVTGTNTAAIGGATGAANAVAGRFPSTPVPPGYRCHLQQRGPATMNAAAGSTFVAGGTIIAAAAAGGSVDTVAIGTAPGSQAIGSATGPASAGTVQVWMDIQPIE